MADESSLLRKFTQVLKVTVNVAYVKDYKWLDGEKGRKVMFLIY